MTPLRSTKPRPSKYQIRTERSKANQRNELTRPDQASPRAKTGPFHARRRATQIGVTYWSVGMMPDGCFSRSTGSLPSSVGSAIDRPRIPPNRRELAAEMGGKGRAGRKNSKVGVFYRDREQEGERGWGLSRERRGEGLRAATEEARLWSGCFDVDRE